MLSPDHSTALAKINIEIMRNYKVIITVAKKPLKERL